MLPSSHRLRQYSITSDNDSDNIDNDRCPEYALNWEHLLNQQHWLPGHDYFLGNSENITDNEELRKILSEKFTRGTLTKKIIFCDLDGVLADFEKGVINRFNKPIDELNRGIMWGFINKSKTFFEKLPWMPKGRKLWEQIKQYDPIILTGVGYSSTAAEQKRKWCERELGKEIHVITCSSKNKQKFCITNSILIDDLTNNLTAWNSKGGKFILYNENIQEEIIEKIHKYMETEQGLNTP